MMPRSHCSATRVRRQPFNEYEGELPPDVQIYMAEHLDRLSVKFHLKHYEVRAFRSLWSVTESLKKAMQQINLVPSAKRHKNGTISLEISLT